MTKKIILFYVNLNFSFSDRVNNQRFNYIAENASGHRFNHYVEKGRFPQNRNIDNTRRNNWDFSQQGYPQRNNNRVSKNCSFRFEY